MNAWISKQVRSLFRAEIANEEHGGVSPGTVLSSIDSFLQAPDMFFPDKEDQLVVAFSLLGFVMDVGVDAEIGDLV